MCGCVTFTLFLSRAVDKKEGNACLLALRASMVQARLLSFKAARRQTR